MGASTRIGHAGWTWGLLATLAAVSTSIVLLTFRAGEPLYRGRELSFWLKDYSRPPGFGSSQTAYRQFAENRREVEQAVRAVGSDSVPMLRKMLLERDSRFKALLMRNQTLKRLSPRGLLARYLEPAWRNNVTAAQALSLLGPGAKETVPDLIRTLQNNPDEEARRCAAACLGSIGPSAASAVPVLTRASIMEPSGQVRSTALDALVSIGPARTNGLPIAWPYRNTTNERIRVSFLMTIDVVDPERVYGRGTLVEPGTEPNSGG